MTNKGWYAIKQKYKNNQMKRPSANGSVKTSKGYNNNKNNNNNNSGHSNTNNKNLLLEYTNGIWLRKKMPC